MSIGRSQMCGHLPLPLTAFMRDTMQWTTRYVAKIKKIGNSTFIRLPNDLLQHMKLKKEEVAVECSIDKNTLHIKVSQ